eukprot:Skav209827  [mRNA]  locus=scaffold2703:54063:54476:+ [translate_table: standard]
MTVLLETGIAKQEGDQVVVQASEAHRLATCDEKGLSQRSDEVSKGIVPVELKKRGASTAPALSFAHLTILSFLPLRLPDGLGSEHLPVGVIVPFTKTKMPRELRGQKHAFGPTAQARLQLFCSLNWWSFAICSPCGA